MQMFHFQEEQNDLGVKLQLQLVSLKVANYNKNRPSKEYSVVLYGSNCQKKKVRNRKRDAGPQTRTCHSKLIKSCLGRRSAGVIVNI